jgi:hypothetical protein
MAHRMVLLSVQSVGVILIPLVIFGIPSNFATVLGLAGAGLTVALKTSSWDSWPGSY